MTKGREATTSSTRTFRSSNAPPEDKKKPKKQRPKVRLDLQKVLILVLVLFSVFMLQQYHSAKNTARISPSATNSQQATSVVSRVNKLIILPKNETPKIFVVKDLSKLKGNDFYAGAKNGDITLVYTNEKRAVLYRPSDNVIVNVANVTLGSGATNQ